MAGYSPLKITGMTTGLVQERENFLLPNDAYPTLENAYVWRERIKRKQAYQLLGRLRRKVGTTNGAGNLAVAITPTPLNSGYSQFYVDTDVFVDSGGANPATLRTNGSGSGSLNRTTGQLQINGSIPNTDVFFYPGLPVMGIRTRELADSANDQTIFFDQCYAYIYTLGTNNFEEFIPGTTWNAHAAGPDGSDFFFSTNYWQSDGAVATPFATTGNKLFWVTNNTGQFGALQDPPRITDGVTWVDFFPSAWSQIDSTNFLGNFLSMLPFRGRMVTFNTWEGTNAASLQHYSNRVRWSTIGNPFIAYAAGPPAVGSWRDDIRGQGGYLDIPTSEDIVAVGFVRDNLVIYCERSTWQLRYTGRSIAPFQIERVNSELGAESPFSAVQFDTSLVGIGDKGVVECDSYKSERIDIKIPDLVFDFNSVQNGVFRVHGIRDFINRLAFWTYPYAPGYDPAVTGNSRIYPNRRLCYNYENDSWAIFTDSLTTLGNFQAPTARRWIDISLPWKRCSFSWITGTEADPLITGGTQHGFIEVLDQTTSNDPSLFVTNIIGFDTTATVVTCPNHNLTSEDVISFRDIPLGSDFQNLNYPQQGLISNATQANPCVITSTDHRLTTGMSVTITDVVGMEELNVNTYTITVINANTFSLDGVNSTSFTPYVSGGVWTSTAINVFGIEVIDQHSFELYVYSVSSADFDDPQLDPSTYVYDGGAVICVRDNFSVKSKKFNFLDEGENIQMGYLDILMVASEPENPGAISLSVYLDYDDVNASNLPPDNDINDGSVLLNPDTFFNNTIPTTQSSLSGIGGTKFWQRVYCPTRANFLTLEYTFSNAQMAGIEQEIDVQIDAQVLWIRKAGRMSSI